MGAEWADCCSRIHDARSSKLLPLRAISVFVLLTVRTLVRQEPGDTGAARPPAFFPRHSFFLKGGRLAHTSCGELAHSRRTAHSRGIGLSLYVGWRRNKSNATRPAHPYQTGLTA